MTNTYLNPLLDVARKRKTEIPDTFRHLRFDQLNWQPTAESWSVGQCLDHLITINRLYFPVFADLAAGRKKKTFWERLPILPGMFGAMIVQSVLPENTKKTKTLGVFEPRQSDIPLSVLDDFGKMQQELIEKMTGLDFLDHQKVIITSPAASFVVYSLQDACTLLTPHEDPHFDQAKRVVAMEQFPA